MITLPAGARVLLASQPVDFRKGVHGLAALAAEVLNADPFSGAVLVFRAKRADRIKIVLWDGSGLVLIAKQLEGGAFRWPPIIDGAVRLTPVEFAALFDGIDWTRVQSAKRIPMPSLPEDPAALRALLLATLEQRDAALAERDALATRNEQLHHLLLKLKRRQFGQKSERLPEDQLLFAFE